MNNYPLLDERADYIPNYPAEMFIVPLLSTQIHNILIHDISPSYIDGQTVLDIGCGKQPFRKMLERIGFKYYSLDISNNHNVPIDYVSAIDNELPVNIYKSVPFNLIFCTEVLEHIANWDKTFKNISDLTTKGSKVLITCPHFYLLHEEPYDYWRPTLYAIEHFAIKYGFIMPIKVKAGDAYDIIGTILSSSYSIPINNSIQSRIIYRLINISIKTVYKILKHRRIQKLTRIQSPFYMSNVVILEKDM